MTALLTPPRRRGVEILDLPDVDPEVVTRSLADVARCNALFGGLSSALDELRSTFNDLPRCATLLDVGTGLGDIPCRARALARKNGRGADHHWSGFGGRARARQQRNR